MRGNKGGKSNDRAKNTFRGFSGKNHGKSRNREVKYPIPGTTKDSINNPLEDVSNLSLLLQKYAPFSQEKGTYKATVSMLKRLGFRANLKQAVETYTTYLNSYLKFVSRAGRTFVMKTGSRLVVGLGDESVYETSMRLLRNHGVPYIPGSALKGISRSYAVEMLSELLEGSSGFPKDFYARARVIDELLMEEELEKFPESTEVNPSGALVEFLNIFGVRESKVNPRKIAEKLVELFGARDIKGRANFFDALPSPSHEPSVEENQLRVILQNIIEFDIMNPHYGPYYQGKEPPGDWHSPVPVLFLTVRKGTPFVFAVGGEMEEIAEKLLRKALKHHGVGAKTSLGYGRFG